MKSARKPLVITLAFLTILSALNTTAFAQELSANDSNAAMTPNTAVISDIQAVDPPQSAASYIASNGEAPVVTPGDNTGTPADDQTALSSEQPSDAISEAKPPVDIGPGVVLTLGQEIAVLALKYNGFKYVYGAASPSVGFDCSGFAYYIYKQFGYTLPRTAHLQYRDGSTIEKSDLQPGDLIFFATYGGRSVTHVGFYIGNNQFIHAATTRQGVIISELDNSYWSKAWVGAKRIITNEMTLASA